MTPATQIPKEDYLRRLRAGIPVEFAAPPADHEETQQEREARTIPTHWIEKLVEKNTQTVAVPIQISNAIVDGDLNLGYAVFESNFSMSGCELTGTVNCSFTEFNKAVSWRHCRFLRQSSFRGLKAACDFDVEGAFFAEVARFQDLHCEKVLSATDTIFAEADFQRVRIGKDAVFAAKSAGKHTTFGGRVRFDGAQIGGDANFCSAEFRQDARFDGLLVEGNVIFRASPEKQRVTFQGKVNFNGTKIAGASDFSGVDFHDGAWFDGVRFVGPVSFRSEDQAATFAKNASFPSASFGLNARFIAVGFSGEADFENAHFAYPAYFDFAHFDGKAIFASSNFARSVVFRGASFKNDVHFNTARIGGDANFSGASFKALAAFDGVRVEGAAYFRTDTAGQRTQFEGDSRFHGMSVSGNVEFDGAQFLGKANFNRLQVTNDAFFRTDQFGNQLTFGQDADFLNMHVAGAAEFKGTRFEKTAVFEGIHIGNNAFFRPDDQNRPTHFGGPAQFLFATFGMGAQFKLARFRSDASFDNACFKGLAQFSSAEFAEHKKASFKGVRFERGASLDSVQFRGNTDFTAAMSERDIHFSASRFWGTLSLQEAHFHSIFFGEPAPEQNESWWRRSFIWTERTLAKPTLWEGSVDLHGLTYERIQLFLPALFTRLQPFYRQPYSQLEATLRAMGDDQRARLVYLERRRRERKHKYNTGQLLPWLLDWAYGIVANYGVTPFRLLLWSFILIALGGLIFDRPCSVDSVRPEPTQAVNRLPKFLYVGIPHSPTAKSSETTCAQISSAGALGVSLHYFLPMDVPLGADFKPAAGLPSWYATIFLRVAGAILMGIGLAAITGILRRIAQ